jgi:hypothetical protein
LPASEDSSSFIKQCLIALPQIDNVHKEQILGRIIEEERNTNTSNKTLPQEEIGYLHIIG